MLSKIWTVTIYGGAGINFWQVSYDQYEALLVVGVVQNSVSPEVTNSSLQWTIPTNIFYMLSTDFAKVSLLFFYLHLSPDRSFRRLVQGLIACFGLYGVVYALISIFGCVPIYAAWDLVAQATGKCINKTQFFLAASIANVFMDVIILLIPLRIVVPLQIPKRQKLSLIFLFTTGGLYVFTLFSQLTFIATNMN
jgi:hypothetical protein